MSIQAKRSALFGLAALVALGLLVFVIGTAQVNAQRYVAEGSGELGVRSGAALARSSSLSLFWEEDFDAPISSSTYYTAATSGSGVVSNAFFLLTRNAGSQHGRIFYLTPTLMSEFTATFRLYLGDYEGGADGVAFIFCPSYDYPPVNGGLLDASCPGGYLVAFDTWGASSDQVYVAFQSTAARDRLEVSNVPQLEDGVWHTAGVDFKGGTITVTLDGSDVIAGATLPGYDPFLGYFGFGGATGGASNEQRVDEIQVAAPPLVIVKTAAPTLLDPGDPLTYTLTFRNSHPTITATDVVITDIVSLGLSGYTYTTSGALITPTGSVDYVWQVEDLAPGTGGVITISGLFSASVLPAQAFTNTARLSGVFSDVLRTYSASAAVTRHGADLAVGKADALDPVGAGERLTYTVTVTNHGPSIARWSTWADNPSIITIDPSGAVIPYPSTIAVSGLSGDIIKTTVTLSDVNHMFPDNMDVLLVGPSGQSVLLMSDAGDYIDLNNVRLTFDDAAPGPLPDETQIASGDYQPTNYDGGDADTFDAPAPAGPYGTALSVFEGTDPNGTWSLYVMDDLPSLGGSIAGGWSLSLVLGNSGTLTDVLPGGVTFLSASPGCHDTGGGIITCTVDGLLVGATTEITIAVTAPGTAGPITNTVSVAGVLEDPEPSNDTASESTWVSTEADLAVGKTVNDLQPYPGRVITYSLSVVNHGPTSAAGIVISDALPLGVTYVSSDTTHGTYTAASGAWALGALSVNRSAQLTLTVQMDPGLAGGTRITNTAVVSASSQIDPDAENDAASAAFQVAHADLAVGKADALDPVGAGERLTYTLTVTNHGPSTLGGSTRANRSTITIPSSGASGAAIPYPSTIAVSGLSAGIIKAIVTLHDVNHIYPDNMDVLLVGPSGQSVVLMSDAGAYFGLNNVQLTFDDDAPGPLPEFAQIASSDYQPTNYYGGDADAFSAPAPAGPYGAALSVFEGTDPNGTWSLYVMDDYASWGGGSITGGWSLSLVLGNSGTLTDVLPGGVTFLSASPGCHDTGGGVITCTVGGLPVGATAEITVAVTAPGTAGPITNTVSVAGVLEDPEPSNNTASESTRVSVEADLGVSKRDWPDPVLAGDWLTYTFVVTNNGPDWAGGVVLSDALPAGVSYDLAMALQLDEAAGATHFEDGSGRGHHGTCSGETCPTAGVSGRYGQAAQFDGVDDYISLPDLPSCDKLTVGMWVKIPGLPPWLWSLINHDGWGSDNIHLHLGADGTISFGLDGNEPMYLYSTFAFDSTMFNQWTHLAYVYDTEHKQISFYVNGALDVVRSLTTAIAGDLGPGRIGDWESEPSAFEGEMDEVVVYSRALTAIEVAALYQAGFSDPTLSISQGTCTIDGGLMCDLGIMPPGSVATVTLPVRVSSAQTETLTNTAYVSGYLPDPTPGNDVSTRTTDISEIDLALTKSAAPTYLSEGDDVTYILLLVNNGLVPASGVVVSDTLPLGVTFVSSSTTHGDYDETSGAWSVGALNVGESATLHITATVDADTAGDTIVNRAAISASDQLDLLTANNAADATVTVSLADIYLPLVIKDY